MQNFWIFFIKKKSFTILLIISLIVSGIFSLISITKESAPEIQIPLAIISTYLPGAFATDTEKLITNKIENQLINNCMDLWWNEINEGSFRDQLSFNFIS